MQASKMQWYLGRVFHGEGVIQTQLRRNNFLAGTKALSEEDGRVC